MIIDLSLLLFLVLLNGAFAMSEIALVSSRRARLLQMASAGHSGAQHALTLTSEPTRFLSSVQVGITSIGILSGAIGEASVAARLREGFEQWPAVAPYAHPLSVAIMVIGLTYVSLILGELVPKRLALTHPEAIASVIARPMEVLATIGRPLVRLLSFSTDAILRLFGVRQVKQPGVTVDEVRVMLKQGTEEGVFEPREQEMVTNVLHLDDRHVGSVLTPRADVVFLDLQEPDDINRQRLRQDPHAVVPLCDGGLDHVIGMVRSSRVLERVLAGAPLELTAIADPPLFVPETMSLMKLLEQFKRTALPVALVVDEHGSMDGLVSMTDVISTIVGEIPDEPGEDPAAVQRGDGSWLLDGALDIETVARTIDDESLLSDPDRPHYHTLGGLAMLALGRVPRTGDIFERGAHRFEVVDMDGNRVDRLMASRRLPRANPGGP
jgi:putative hemolysin